MSMLAQILALLGGSGLPDRLPDDPFELLKSWFDEACRSKATANPDSIVLATATLEGRPSARVVLCKEIRARERAIVFYTNLESRKGRELAKNPYAAAVFHFDAFGRQARIEGIAQKLSESECDAYFATRAPLAKLGAWASHQSQPIASRVEFAQQIIDAMRKLGISPMSLIGVNLGATPEITRPPHWGGFKLIAQRVELWSNASGRLHDRAEWVCEEPGSKWMVRRLQP